jgi:hypothetical protein
LVKGKSIWRITSVETIEPGNFMSDMNKLSAIKNIFSLLLRLLHGEEKNEQLFLSAESFYNFLLNNKLSLEDIKNLETITVLRILYYLGYFQKTFELSDYVKDSELSIDMLNLFNNKRGKAVLDINKALNETNL